MPPTSQPLVATAGIIGRDEFLTLDHYPVEGSFATIEKRFVSAGGTTGNITTGLARLGAQVRLFAKVGDDAWGRAVVQGLVVEGVDTAGVLIEPGETDLSVMLVSGQTGERTILWKRGPDLRRGDRIDIDRLFKCDLTVLDVPDHELLRFLTDLPAHTYPNALLLGTLTYLSDVVARDKVDVACRFDVLVGNEREYCLLTGESSPDSAFRTVCKRMIGSTLRTAVMTRGGDGAVAGTAIETVEVDALRANVIDTTGAGDAFVAGLSYALGLRWKLPAALRLANAVAASVVGALGAQTALPSLSEALDRAGLTADNTCDSSN